MSPGRLIRERPRGHVRLVAGFPEKPYDTRLLDSLAGAGLKLDPAVRIEKLGWQGR